MIKIYAHRGNKSEFPENSLQAFRSAIELGVDGIECDVHVSADGQAIIIHDETIDRTTTGEGEIINMSLNEIKAFHLLNPDNRLSDEKIPTLEEMLEEFDRLAFNGELNIELKTDRHEYEGIEKLVKQTVEAKPRAYRIIYSSFNWKSIERMAELQPKAELALLIAEPLLPYQKFIPSLDPSALHVHFKLVEELDKAYTDSLPLRLWTVNESNEIEKWLKSDVLNVEGLMTDYPRQALKLRETMNSL
ncbi:glycerophosphodiester phosphodiesterase family protein [Fundicoccus sp. Sow4_D5]|uniref:glycerophosphodiester phosphodiesterase family protein n=1 Tax=unclassified Fundicoccus TaxID=2761543 RepID=UPI003F8DD4B1